MAWHRGRSRPVVQPDSFVERQQVVLGYCLSVFLTNTHYRVFLQRKIQLQVRRRICRISLLRLSQRDRRDTVHLTSLTSLLNVVEIAWREAPDAIRLGRTEQGRTPR